ncbi:ABC transporter substrate-binding protein [Alkalihalobacterium elongatum]|uniref:ABC transporter substrate-binding protein n=1 Tax=Alkalihalobacterium elongatum TaxID=2675466 RepID=UPI001C1F5497|nr:ABC transporter substrate-binding protein [Alkalihalobacterium elongatum]
MKKTKGLNKLLVLCFSLIFILAACTTTQTETSPSNDSTDTSTTEESSGEKVLRVSMTAAPGNLDPHFSSTHAELEIIQPIFNGLLRYKPGTADFETIEGDLAESWDVSEDGLVWTFHLREGVQWHKGYGELTSEDVKWSLERVMDPEVGSPRASSFKFVDSVEATDTYTVTITLKEPNPSFILSLVAGGVSGGAIVNKDAIEAGGEDADKLIGTGPFVLESYTPGESAILVKNSDYFRGEPKIDRVERYIMRDLAAREVAMDRGDIDFSYGEPDGMWFDQRSKNQDLTVETSGLPMVWSIHLNTTIEPLNDIRVRQAIAHAMNPNDLVASLGEGIAKPMTSVLTNNVFGHSDIGAYEYNPEKSKQLLAEAGYPNGLKLPESLGPNIPAYVPVNNYIVEQLRQVGIEMPFQTVDTPTWITALYGDQSAVTLTIGLQALHGSVQLFSSYHSEGAGNFTHYNKSDSLIEQAERELDEGKSLELMKQIQEEILADYVNVPLLETVQVNAWRNNVDLGYELKATPLYVAPIYETTDIK